MRKALSAAVSSAIVVAGLGWSSAASAAEEVTLYEDDLAFCDKPNYDADTTCGPNAETSHQMKRGGIRLTSASYAGYALGTFPLSIPFADLDTVAMDWTGTEGEPGQRIEIDINDDGTADGRLFAERLYGPDTQAYDDDLWAAGTEEFLALAPSTTGGSGSTPHGSLDAWQKSLPINSTVVRGGYVLGVPGQGVLHGLTYGDTTYRFTSDDKPLPVKRPVADATVTVPKRTVAKVKVTATQPEGTVSTPKGAFYRVLRTKQGAAADGVIEKSEIVSYLAKGRVREGSDDAHRFRFRKVAKVTVVSYGEVLADKRVLGKK